MKCKQCGRAVRNRFQNKWKHIVNYHPEVMAKHLLPFIFDPLKAYKVGKRLAVYGKSIR